MGISSDARIAASTAEVVGLRVVDRESTGVLAIADSVPGESICLGRYELRAPIGIGGFGVVLEAWDRELLRRVAVKLVRIGRTSSREAMHRLLREARSLASLEHPNIVQIYDVGRYGPEDFGAAHPTEVPERGLYIVMELIDGVDLEQWLAADRRSWPEILDVFLQAGAGLAAAHSVGMLHRDFKPANVIVADDGRARVVDFGLARILREGQSTMLRTHSGDEVPLVSHDPVFREAAAPIDLTGTGKTVGTPAYMAPEQFTRGASSPRTDQYAFAVSVYEGLYGRRPFAAEDVDELLDLKLLGPPTHDPANAPPIPSRVRRALMRSLERAPHDRHASVAALLDALSPRRLRRWKMAGLLGVCLLGVWALVQPQDRCQPGEAAWNVQARMRVEGSLLSSSLSYAPQTAAIVSAQLDDFVSDWHVAHAEACRDGGPTLDVRMQCLRRAEADAAALIDVLGSTDTKGVTRAAVAAASLPAPADCLDATAEREPLSSPVVESLYADLARAQALQRSGNPEEGLPLAQDVLERAAKAGDARLAARSEYLAGVMLMQQARYDEARDTLESAFFGADVVGLESTRTRAAMRLALLEGLAGRDAELQAQWVRHAETSLARLGDPEPLAAQLHNQRGNTLLDRGHIDAADAAFRTALHALGDDGDPVARQVTALGLSATALARGELEAAERHGHEAVQLVTRHLGAHHPNMTPARLALFSALRARGELAAALAQNTLAIQLVLDNTGPEHADYPGLLMNEAITQAMLGRTESARTKGSHALELMMRRYGTDHPAVITARRNVGYLELDSGRPDRARPHLEAALLGSQRDFGEGSPQAAAAHAGVGRAYEDLNRIDEAIEHYQRARSIHETHAGEQSVEVASDLVNLARAHHAGGDDAAARQAATTALAIRRLAQVEPLLMAEAEFALAQSSWSRPARRTEARALAEDALDTFTNLGDIGARFGVEVDAWLEAHPLEPLERTR